MRQLQRKAEQIARAEERHAVSNLVADLKVRLGSATIEESGETVTVSGPGILRRWLNDPLFRFIGGGRR